MNKSTSAAWALIITAGLACASHGAVKYVRADAAPGGTGASWASAYTQVSIAIAAAAPGDEVWVATGTYQPIIMASGVAIYGGFSGGETQRDERDPEIKVTILDGANTAEHVAIATMLDSSAVLDGFTLRRGYSLGGNPGGAAGMGGGGTGGGGIAILGGSPTIRNCTITDNQAGEMWGTMDAYEGFGGGVYIAGGASPTFDGCTISNNEGMVGSTRPDAYLHFPASGGGVAILSSSPVFRNCTIIGNTAGAGDGPRSTGSGTYCCNQPGANGGGVYIVGAGSPRFEGCIISGNIAGQGGSGAAGSNSSISPAAHGSGGGVYISGASTTFVNCVFSENTTPDGMNALSNSQWGTQTGAGSGSRGGALFVNSGSGTTIVMNSTFAGNSTGKGGKGAAQLLSPPVLPGAGGSGGDGSAICFSSTALHASIANCVFTGNHCGDPGAGGNGNAGGGGTPNGPAGFAGNGTVANAGTNVVIANSTLHANSTLGSVAGVAGPASKIYNSILWNNSANGATTQAAQTTSNNLFYSDISGFVSTPAGTGNINIAPGFIDADGADNVLGTPDDDLHVAASSPVVDAGSVAHVPADAGDLDGDSDVVEILPLDLAMLARVVDIAGAPGTGVDIGAFEAQVPPSCAADLDDGSGSGTSDGGVDINDLLFFLTQFEAGASPADLDNGSGTGVPDGGVDINDLLFFLVRFEAGC